MALPLPPALDERDKGLEFALVVGGPVSFGAITGIALGASEPLYLVLSVLGILGGFGAGVEHHDALEGWYRGLLGGLLFGSTILITNGIVDKVPKADLPDPAVYLIAITAIAGSLLGAAGGAYRARRTAAEAGPTSP
jgi:hypothetical protein